MNRKQIAILIIICSIFIVIAALAIPKDELSMGQYNNMVVKVAGDNNFPPYEFYDENNNYTGFNVDIMRAVALVTGMEIKYYPMPWNQACEDLKNGKVDIIQGMKYSRERDLYYDFSQEYLENSQSIFVLSENEDVKDFKDLNGKRIAVQRGDAAATILYNLRHYTAVYAENQEDAIHQVMGGKADAFIGNTITGVFLIDKMGIRDEIKIVGDTLNPTIYSMAVKEGNKELLNIINKGINEIKRNGTYDIIYRKWFGRSVNYPSPYFKKIIIIASSVILIFAAVAIIFLRWNKVLKKEADERTVQIKLESDFREKLLNEIFSGVMTINSDNIITFANKPAHKILGTESSKLVGLNYKQTYIKHFLDDNDWSEKTGEKELKINDKDIFIKYRIKKMKNLDNKQDIILIFKDITEEKIMQQSLITKDKMQCLGNLITGIAHEIRNPLTAIKIYTQLIPKKINDANFREVISKDIPQEVERLDNLIKDLLEYSKPRKPFKEKIQLYEAVNNVLFLIKNNTQQESIKIETNIDKNTFVEFDKYHLQQILINILLNAVESMDKEEKTISIWAENREECVALSIKDNGCGMSKKTLSSIYDPFFTTKPTGTGLGLYVSYQLLTQNNGNIFIDTVEGKGTTFTIVFKKTGEDMNI